VRILVTAGPTQEYFDTVRFVSNPSTGKMGYALAAEACQRNHDVVLVSGPVAIAPPTGVVCVRVTSAAEMFDAAVEAFDQCDAAIMTAAVCDYRPARRLNHKLKKRPQMRHVTLLPTRDIAAHLGAIKGRRVVVGFAMEDHDQHARAEHKLAEKRCDAIVLNGRENVGNDNATVEILLADGGWQPPRTAEKTRIAQIVLDVVERTSCNRS